MKLKNLLIVTMFVAVGAHAHAESFEKMIETAGMTLQPRIHAVHAAMSANRTDSILPAVMPRASSDTCFAYKVGTFRDGFGAMKYQVYCQGKSFSSPEIVTGLFIPFPYNWGKVARSRLYQMMDAKGYHEVSKVTPVQNKDNNDPIHIFAGAAHGSSHYCTVVRHHTVISGLSSERKLFDAIINCDDERHEEKYNAITEQELNMLMRGKGYQSSIRADVGIEYGCGFGTIKTDELMIYESSPLG